MSGIQDILISQAERYKQTIREHVEGRIKADHDETGHWYILPSGRRVASVTTKLNILHSPHLKRWAAGKAVDYLIANCQTADDLLKFREQAILHHQDEYQAAGLLGTTVHGFCDGWIKAKMSGSPIVPEIPMWDPQAVAAIRSFVRWYESNNVIPIASELLLGDERLNTAGSCDFICILDEKLTLVDWKTSNQISQENYSAQTAAYKYMFERMTGLKIRQVKIVQLSKKDDRAVEWRVNNVSRALNAFKNISKLYSWMQEEGKITNKDKIKL